VSSVAEKLVPAGLEADAVSEVAQLLPPPSHRNAEGFGREFADLREALRL
jgi:hypothetical protein